MASTAPQTRPLQDVFISFVVDSSTPSWDEIHEKYTSKMVNALGHVLNAKPRLSFILYTSASSHAQPIIKDEYFSLRKDYEAFSKAIAGPLTAPISRPLPRGGSASLEGLIRAIEHFDFLARMEPGSSQSQKHIFWVTASPPDDSSRPIHNNNNAFDDFGWKECENWLRDKSIALNLILARLPGDPQYLSFFRALNPEALAPMPPSGPLRVHISTALSVLIQPGARSQTGQTAPSSLNPVPAHPSPASLSVGTPAAASPNNNRKRKPEEEAQPSPKRNKFPPAVSGHLNEPVPMQIEGSSGQTLNESKPVNPPEPPPATSQSNPSINQPTVPHQTPGSNPNAVNSSQADRQWQLHLNQALQKSPAEQLATIVRLRGLHTQAEHDFRKAAFEGKQAELHALATKRDRIRQFVEILGRAHQERLNRGQGNTITPAPGPNNGPGLMGTLSTTETKPVPTDVPEAKVTVPGPGTTALAPSTSSAGITSEVSQLAQNQGRPLVPTPARSTPVWTGQLSITNNGKSVLDVLVTLTLAKGNVTSAQAPSFWPKALSIRPFRQGVVPQQLVQWLANNQPDGVYTVNVASIEDLSPQLQARASEGMMTQMKMKFIQAQANIANARFVLMGAPPLSTGGSNTILVFYMPAPSSVGGDSLTQLVLARYINAPNLATLPGTTTGGAQKTQEAPSTSFNPPSTSTLPINPGAPILNNAQSGAYGGLNTGMPTLANQPTANPSNPVNPGSSMTATTLSGHQQIALALNRLGPRGQEFLRSIGGVGNPDLINLVKSNPELTTQLRAMFQGQSQSNNASTITAAAKGHVPTTAAGNRMPGVGGPLGGNLSGATLLDRLDNGSSAQSSKPGGNPSALAALYGSQLGRNIPMQQQQTQQQQQLLAALSGPLGGTQSNLNNHGGLFGQIGGLSSNPTALSMSGNNTANTSLGSSATGPNNMSFMHGMNIPALGGAMGRGLNSMNPGMNTGMSAGSASSIGGANATGSGSFPSQAIMAHAKMLAERQGISVPEAMVQIVRNLNLNPNGWNPAGHAGGT
ncbi:hypothetical protein FRC17_008809 [Serendipita sp. 399]|nr:hypothetical protein FRC17_008809 [Serendipita sp. 399]